MATEEGGYGQGAAPTGGAGAPGGAGGPDGEIELTMLDKMRRMVSTDEEWDAILLQKMELKRNREQGLPDPPAQPFSLGSAVGNVGAAIGGKVGGVLGKAKAAIPVQLPNMPNIPNIPIPGLNKGAGGATETIPEGGEGFTQIPQNTETGLAQ